MALARPSLDLRNKAGPGVNLCSVQQCAFVKNFVIFFLLLTSLLAMNLPSF